MEWSFKLPPSLGGGDFVLRELTIDTLEHIQDRVLWVAGRDDAKLMQASRDAQKEQLFRAIVSWQGEPVAAPELWWRERTSKERACTRPTPTSTPCRTTKSATSPNRSSAPQKSEGPSRAHR